MLMDKVAKIMDEYFETVTPEQFEKDLIEAGIENCPNKCDRFGNLEWDVVSCVDCAVDNKVLFNACWDESHKDVKPKKGVE